MMHRREAEQSGKHPTSNPGQVAPAGVWAASTLSRQASLKSAT
jgi:hypothetical protein